MWRTRTTRFRAVRVVEAHDRVGVRECPCLRAFWEAADDVETCEGRDGLGAGGGRGGCSATRKKGMDDGVRWHRSNGSVAMYRARHPEDVSERCD